MTKQVQLRRGTSAEHASFTGAVGELTIDTTLDVGVVHDGSTVGGHPLVGTRAPQTIVNKTSIGIGTTVANSELVVVGNADISGSVNSEYLNINERFLLTKTGIISAVSSNRILGIATLGLRKGDTVTIGAGVTLGTGSTSIITGFGSDIILLADNFASRLVNKTGRFEFPSSFSIIGINTASISVGYGITGQYLRSDEQVFSVGIDQIQLTYGATNPFSGEVDILGNTTAGSNVIAGVSALDTAQVEIGAFVEDLDSPSNISAGTTVVSKTTTTITISTNATQTLAGTTIGLTRDYNFVLTPPPITDNNIVIGNPKAGRADIPRVYSDFIDTSDINSTAAIVNTLFSDTSYTNQANINSGIITTASINSAVVSNLNATTVYSNDVNINTGIITSVIILGSNITNSNTNTARINIGIITSATITGAGITNLNVQTSTTNQANINIGILTTATIGGATVTNINATNSYTNTANINSGIITTATITGATVTNANISTSHLLYKHC